MTAKIIKERMEKDFSEGLVKLESSEVYGKFCERLYGKNLCQLNMMPMNQLDNLLEVISYCSQLQGTLPIYNITLIFKEIYEILHC